MKKRDIPSPFDHDFIKGGPGSGNFGHRGRPGIQGGSAKEGGGEAPKEAPKTRYEQAVEAAQPIGNLTKEEVLAYERDALIVLAHVPHSVEEKNLLGQMTINGNIKIPDVQALLRRMSEEGKIHRVVRLGGKTAYASTGYKDPYLTEEEDRKMRNAYLNRRR